MTASDEFEVREAAGSVSFLVRAQSRASRSEIIGQWQGALRIRLAAPALEGQANEALCRLLAQCLHVPPGAVTIARGQRSRNKRVEIRGVSPSQVRGLLSPADAASEQKSGAVK